MPQQAQQIRMELQGSLRRLHELPPLAPGVQRLLIILADEDSELEDIARAIEQIPALTARVIGLASSAYFGGQKVRGVFDAIVRVLGLNLVRSLATAIAVGEGFDARRCPSFNPERHWAGALLTANLARLLAEGTVTDEPIQPDEGYLCGLLYNLGLLAMVHIAPRETGAALAQLEQDSERSLVDIETDLMGVHHRQVGAWLAFRWQLPPEVGIVMQHHREPDYRGPSWTLSLLVGIAANWAQQHLAGVAAPSIDPTLLDALGFDQTVLAARAARCLATAGKIEELARLMAQPS